MYKYRYFGGFRLFLALLVTLQHFIMSAAPHSLMIALQGYEIGTVAVLAFFCLSGFVIAEAIDIAYRARPAAFLGNRLLRVYPHYVLAVAMCFLLQRYYFLEGTLRVEPLAVQPTMNAFGLKNLLFNALYIFPGMERFTFSFVPIAWAVRIEMSFYIFMYAALLAARFLPTKWARFEVTATLGFLLLIPLFIIKTRNHSSMTADYIPYFSFGVGLYFALMGKRTGIMVTLLSFAGLLWQFLIQPAHHPTMGFPREVGAEVVELLALLGSMMWLARASLTKWRESDQSAGAVTYPLYMHHYAVLIVASSCVGYYSYGIFILGILDSIVFSVVLAKLVDPLVDRLRDKVRGRALEKRNSSRRNDFYALNVIKS